VCLSDTLEVLLDLGHQPLANAFLTREQLGSAEPRYPLEFCRCTACGHAQLSVTVSPELMFRSYPYVSGTSDAIPAHFAKYAREVGERFAPSGGRVIEIGSNDGTLLKAFDRARYDILGVEPATNIATIATRSGVPTRNDFFSERLARQLVTEFGRARLIIANNVVAHIHDLHDLARGVDALLEGEGVFVAEFPYVVDLLQRTEYDTIYHEHLSYFSVRAATDLFGRFDLSLFDARRVPVHGGSLRIFVGRQRAQEQAIRELLAQEATLGLREGDGYREFAAHVRGQREALRGLLGDLKRSGKTLVGYGAPAKGNTLLNFCGIDSTTLAYTVDRSPLKQRLYTPGTHVPIEPTERLVQDRPDYTLLLAWNFADEILAQQDHYRRGGGKFIIPIPAPRVV
jgi:hypothetical protein